MKLKLFILCLCIFTLTSYAQEEIKKELVLEDGWYALDTYNTSLVKTHLSTKEQFSIVPKVAVEASLFESYKLYQNFEGQNGIAVYFDAIGREKWRKLTKSSIGFKIVFILDNEIFSSPMVNAEITGGVCAFVKNKHNKDVWHKLEKILSMLKTK